MSCIASKGNLNITKYIIGITQHTKIRTKTQELKLLDYQNEESHLTTVTRIGVRSGVNPLTENPLKGSINKLNYRT